MKKYNLHCILLIGFFLAGRSYVPAQSVEDYTYLPIVTHLSVSEDLYFSTAFSFVNLTDAIVEGTIEVRRSDGSEIFNLLHPCGIWFVSPPITGPAGFSMPPRYRTVRSMTVHTPAADLVARNINGWGRVKFDDLGDVQVFAEIALIRGQRISCDSLHHHSSDEILDILALPAVRATTSSRLSVTITALRRPAISIVNPSESETAHVKIQLHKGTKLGNWAMIEIPPMRRTSQFLLEIVIPEVLKEGPIPGGRPWKFLGTATITSDIPIAVGSLNVILPAGKLVHVPVETPVD